MKIQTRFAALMVAMLVMPTSGLLAQGTAVQENIDYKTVISDYLEATGGEEAHKAIKSIKATGTMGIPEANIEGKLVSVQDEKHSYTKIELPGLGTEMAGRDGDLLWKVSDMTGPEIIDDERKPMMLRQAKMSPMLSVDEDYDSVECTGTEEFNGETCYVLVMKVEGEDPTYSYFSVESKLQVGGKMTLVDPAQGKMEIVSKISDYKEVGGVKFAHTTAALLPIGMTMMTKIETMEVNSDIDKELFQLPEEIKELKDDK